MSSPQTFSFSVTFDFILRLLSILVIPMIIWGVKLEVTNALQDERIAEMQADLVRLSNVTTQVQAMNVALVRLEEKITNVDGKIRDVERLIRGTTN